MAFLGELYIAEVQTKWYSSKPQCMLESLQADEFELAASLIYNYYAHNVIVSFDITVKLQFIK